jgi:hypothetical protein
MNERIQKFAEEAAWKTRMTHNNAYWWMQEELAEDITWREKFAELIVRECLDSISAHRAEAIDVGLTLDESFSLLINDIKNTFGVE